MTDAKPGSEEKIKVLIFRYKHGLPLWNPKDEKVLTHKKEIKVSKKSITKRGVMDLGAQIDGGCR